MSLRTRLLLGIVAANLAAFAVLAVVVLRDVKKRDRERQEQELIYREKVLEPFVDLFEGFLSRIDFSTDLFAEQSREILDQPFWLSEFLNDAYLKEVIPSAEPLIGDLRLNLTRGPDVEKERVRRAYDGLMIQAFARGEVIREKDVVAVPLYRAGGLAGQRRVDVLDALARGLAFTSKSWEGQAALSAHVMDGVTERLSTMFHVAWSPARPVTRSRSELAWDLVSSRVFPMFGFPALSGEATVRDTLPGGRDLFELMRSTTRAVEAVHSKREPWGAAYVRLAPPDMPQVVLPLTLLDVAFAMVGATLAGLGFVYLLFHVLVLHPLDRIAAAARRMSDGDFANPVSSTGRGDEIDHLIHGINVMQSEIGQSRVALEQRVEAAVERMRETERQLVLTERLAAMGTLAAGIAHEINNPLGGMINATNLLRKKGALNEAQDRFLVLVEDGLSRIRAVVARVLRFSRKGGIRDDVDLRAVLDDVSRFVRHRLVESGATLESGLPDDLRVRGDAAALGQVFLNLLINALDALPPEGGAIRIQAIEVPGAIRITVTDNGSGMTPEQVERAFDHFFTTKDSGTGLGLSIVHQIVSEHGGTVTIESDTDTGTAMHVLLPSSGERNPLAGRRGGPARPG